MSWQRRFGRAALWSILTIGLLSLLAGAALGAGAAVGKKPPKKPTAYLYRLSVGYSGENRSEVRRTQTGSLVQSRNAETRWSGSREVVVRNLGSPAKPKLFISPSPAPVPELTLLHRGNGLLRSASCVETYTESLKQPEGSARVQFSLVNNRVYARFVSSATVAMSASGTCGAAAEDCSNCLVVEHFDAARSAWWAKWSNVTEQLRSFRVGRHSAFKLTRDPVSDASLEQTVDTGETSVSQTWKFAWEFDLEPIRPVR